MNLDGAKILKDVVREPYAWPGGYEKFAIANDGGVLCHECCKKYFKTIMHSTLFEYKDGWDVVGVECMANVDGSLYCDNCSRVVE